ncbi:MMPL family transporter [Enemella sp. A6]|uniref:MMPL family transporter n=1 Tax=Enemella sp. A6 TaxID=3440152 RepID=UPI003EBA7AD8
MSSFLYRLGRQCWQHRVRVLVIWLVALVISGALAGLIGKKFEDSFTLPGTQSQAALDQLGLTFPEIAGASATMIIVAPDGSTVDDPAVKQVIDRAVERFNHTDRVVMAQSPYSDMIDGLVSKDRRAAIVQLQLEGEMTEYSEDDKAEFSTMADRVAGELPGSQVSMGGELYNADVPTVTPVELIGVGVAMIVLLLTLGSIRAASMPLITAIVGVGVTMLLIVTATGLTTINSTTPMLALMLGLAVGIDYALFILSRHRELMRGGLAAEESMSRSVATSGSAVVFAGLTVVIALIGLAVARIPFLTVMGLAAAIGVAIAVLIALTLLPALAGFAGEKMRPKPRKRRRAASDEPEDKDEDEETHAAAPNGDGTRGGGPSGWWVRVITKVPTVTVLIVVIGLGALAIPAKDLRLALPNAGSNPEDSPSRVAYDLITDNFGEGFNGPLLVTAEIIGSNDPLGVMDGLKRDIEAMPGVEMVPLATPNRTADTGIVQVVPSTGPDDPATQDLVQALRDRADEWRERYGVDTAVTGYTAVAIDVSDRLGAALLPFGIFVVGLSLVLLTMVFRSIAVPIKATLGYLLSVLAAFGATALVFEHGFGAALINLTDLGPIISFLPIVLMGILFGLAMDYEVFLVSRMREDYVHSGDARAAVRTGFIGSATVVVAAALIMFAVFAFFVPESPRGTLKPIAFALAMGVALDAFVVRMTLVPAVMAMLGEKAWWLPKWLDRRLPSFDVEGESLHHELEMADWPSADDPHLVYAEGLELREGEMRLFDPVNVRLLPGEVLVIEGDPAPRNALLLALSGRIRPTGGQAKVAGHLLPEQASRVRAHSDVVTAEDPHLVRDLQRAKLPLLVVEGADALHRHADREALAAALARAHDQGRAVLLGVADTELVTDLLPHGYYSLALTTPELLSTR